MTKWVQHISGKGKKWQVGNCEWNEKPDKDYWLIEITDDSRYYVAFPKSEFHEVPAPEVWRDVTAECGYAPPRCGGLSSGMGRIYHEGHTSTVCEIYTQYKMTKVQIGEQWAFIIERKEDAT